MSADPYPFQEISKTFEKIRGHIESYELSDTQRVYPAIRTRLDQVRSLYLDWIAVYEEYRTGFEKANLTRALYPVARFLSSLGTGVEGSFFEVVKARVPIEVYFLVQYFYQEFKCDNNFVLAEGAEFESDTIFGEISRELERLNAPRPHGTQAETFLKKIDNGNYTKIYYDSVMYDSPLTWPLLLHEVFHDIYQKDNIAGILKLPFTESWIPEVVIDLYAAMFFGPVFAVSLAKYHGRFPVRGGLLSHPSQGPRLYGLLQLLGDMTGEKRDFPETVRKIIEDSFKTVSDIWSHYRKDERDVQDRVREVYERVRGPAAEFHKSKGLKTFEEYSKLGGESLGKDFERVASYLDLGIPAAVDPRVLFNALVMSKREPEYEYVGESLRKWRLSEIWAQIRGESQETLVS